MTRIRRQPGRARPTFDRRTLCFQRLERRDLLANVPFGASPSDTAEFMLGDVLVTVVMLESDGTIDEDTETWRDDEIEVAKRNVVEGMQWWEDLLSEQRTNHSLDFRFDFTFADEPIRTGYEPISREWDDFELWIEDFFSEVRVSDEGTFSDRMREFNHSQRLAHDTNWAFTVFIVNAEQDSDGRFDTNGLFKQSFAFAGGRFFVTTSGRPSSTMAHETAHMFWAMDEYRGAKTYFDRRGYYNTQNTNAIEGHPDPDSRVRSIMDSASLGYALNAASPSVLESIGWKDTDRDGIFDVSDVPHRLIGSGSFDSTTGNYAFEGSAQVQTLQNRNSSGTGNDMTINRIDRIEVRFDEGPWQTAAEIGAYRTDLDLSIPVPNGARQIEIRAVDARLDVGSNVFTDSVHIVQSSWQNTLTPSDVNADARVTPIDALLVINELNKVGSHPFDRSTVPPPFLDVNGDGFLSPVDALMVINQLNNAVTGPISDPPERAMRDEPAEAESVVWPIFSWVPEPTFRDSTRFERNLFDRRYASDPTVRDIDPRTRTSLSPFARHNLADEIEPRLLPERTLVNRSEFIDLAMMELSCEALDFPVSSSDQAPF